MKTIIRKISLILFALAISFSVYSQKFGIGASAIYNPETESIGAGLRVEIPKNRISFVPQVSYYPAFNNITEFYGGISLHLAIINPRKWTLYAIGNGSFNGWLNYSSSSVDNSSFSNWGAEAGGGFTTKGCFRPFIEYRYNFKWQETNARFGIIYFFKCKKKKRKRAYCPAYD